MFCRTKPGSDEFVDTQMFRRKLEQSLLRRINITLSDRQGIKRPAPFSINLENLDLFRPLSDYSDSHYFLREDSDPP